jgi:hypothetical protein
MFLLGRDFPLRHVRAAEALLGAGGVYGAMDGELEAKSETVVTGGTEVVDHGHYRPVTCRFLKAARSTQDATGDGREPAARESERPSGEHASALSVYSDAEDRLPRWG